jgi:hypothetical protein
MGEKQKALSSDAQGFGNSWDVLSVEVYTATRRRPEKGRIIMTAIIMARRLIG